MWHRSGVFKDWGLGYIRLLGFSMGPARAPVGLDDVVAVHDDVVAVLDLLQVPRVRAQPLLALARLLAHVPLCRARLARRPLRTSPTDLKP